MTTGFRSGIELLATADSGPVRGQVGIYTNNMKASQGKMEVNQEEMVTTRAGQEKLEVAINAI
jgi:lipopolysaccharide export system protein LptA